MKRLRDHPLIADIERQAVLEPALAARSAEWRDDRIDDVSRKVFGILITEVGPTLPADLDELTEDELLAWRTSYEAAAKHYSLAAANAQEQVSGFAALGWDVTDEYGRPLRTLGHFCFQLQAAIRGEFGAKLPVAVDAETWGGNMAKDALSFRPKRDR